MSEEERTRLDKIESASTDAREAVSDPLYPAHHHTYDFEKKTAAASVSQLNDQDKQAIAQFETMCAENGISPAMRTFFESPEQIKNLSFIISLWNSAKWSEHVRAMEILGVPVTEEDRNKIKEEEERASMLLKAEMAGLAAVAASNPFPKKASGGNLEALTVENAEGTRNPGEEEEEEENTNNDILIPAGIFTSTPTD